MANLNIVDLVKEEEKRIEYPEKILGKGLLQPFNNTNSGARKLMFAVHTEHNLPLMYCEPPLVGTGYEDKFGENSSSFKKASTDMFVLAKIDKFYNVNKNYHYYLLVKKDDGTLDIIERISYQHITETYGYLMNNDYLDNIRIGSKIPYGAVTNKSLAYDENNNRCDGVNLITTYLANEHTKEDSIIISESAANKLSSPLLKKVTVIINDNDILLNVYGDNEVYKTFPDINEEVNNSILCAVRRELKEESLFAQSIQKLKTILMSDEKYTVRGKVIDINIYCNNPEKIEQNFYNNQLASYYKNTVRFSKSFVDAVDTAVLENDGYKMSYELQKMYSINKSVCEGKQYIKDRPFSNIIIEFILLEDNKIVKGDKLSDRYGGKGVLSEIRSDHLMPKLDNDTSVEIIFNICTCVNRLNPGQLFEMSLNHICQRILDYMDTNILHTEEVLELYIRLLKHVSPDQAEFIGRLLLDCDETDLNDYVYSLRDGIRMSISPISESMDIDKLNDIYKEFEGIVKPYQLTVPMKDSSGNIRYIKARRTLPCGKKYVYRLKQYAEEKFSATSLSATNIRNENSRNNANKFYKGLYKKTPIRFGEMESGDMSHLGMENVIINLMLNSVSPLGRRLMEELLTGDPYNVDIKLTDDCKNRNVEIVNSYLKTMGLRLMFTKKPKVIKKGLTCQGLIKTNVSRRKVLIKINENESFDSEYINKAIKYIKNNPIKKGLLYDGLKYDK